VVGIGDSDYEFNLNLTEAEAKMIKIDVNQINNMSECIPLLQNDQVKHKIVINSKNLLFNVLLNLNKSNSNKTFIEYISLNSIVALPNFIGFRDKIVSDLDENYMYLIENNLTQPNKLKFNICVQNQQPKSFEMEISPSDYVYDKEKDEKKRKEKEYIARKEYDVYNQMKESFKKLDNSDDMHDYLSKKTISPSKDKEKEKKEKSPSPHKKEFKFDFTKKALDKDKEAKKDDKKQDDKSPADKKDEKKEEKKDDKKDGKKDEKKEDKKDKNDDKKRC